MGLVQQLSCHINYGDTLVHLQAAVTIENLIIIIIANSLHSGTRTETAGGGFFLSKRASSEIAANHCTALNIMIYYHSDIRIIIAKPCFSRVAASKHCTILTNVV